MNEVIAFPRAVETDHNLTIRIQRSAYADSLRSVRKTRDTWRKMARQAHFRTEHFNTLADATQRAATFLRLHVRLSVPPK